MGLSLNAEQKNIKSLFLNDDVFVIPPYQRDYAWNYDTCYQMYLDITEAFNSKTDYFLGNIVFARSFKDENHPEIIDGQQRLITVWLWLKVFSILVPTMKKLCRLIEVEQWREEDVDAIPKIKSAIYELRKDAHCIEKIWRYSSEDTEKDLGLYTVSSIIDIGKCPNQVLCNFLNIYSWLSEFFSRIDDLERIGFVEYFISHVYFLPIEVKDEYIEQAQNKALRIFETLNNRGQSLEDADIFKAKLYEQARDIGEEQTFILQWMEVKDRCENLGVSVDDLFRYYYHIVRGKNSILTAEKSLREFFVSDAKSPFLRSKYVEIIRDLYKILDVLDVLQTYRCTPNNHTKWLQVIDYYTNRYPQYVIVAYLFSYYDENFIIDKFGCMLQHLVVFCYTYGSSSSIKFSIYTMIDRIMHGEPLGEKNEKYDWTNNFTYFGRLKKGYILLGYFLEDNELSAKYKIVNLIKVSEYDKYSLTKTEIDGIQEGLGNYKVIPLVSDDKFCIDVFNAALYNKDDLLELIHCRDAKIKDKLRLFLKIKD